MRYKANFILITAIILFTLFPAVLQAQLHKDIVLINNDKNVTRSVYNHPHAHIPHTYNILKLAGHTLIFLYQRAVSDQFQPYCILHPSCSAFGVESLRSTNIFFATILTADRLMRCSEKNREYYDDKPVFHDKIFDPVSDYISGNKK